MAGRGPGLLTAVMRTNRSRQYFAPSPLEGEGRGEGDKTK